MQPRYGTITLANPNPDLTATTYYFQVDGHPRVRITLEESSSLALAAQEEQSVDWVPSCGAGKEESLRFQLTDELLDMLPPRAFDELRAGRPIEIPGPIGILSHRVGGVKMLAGMMQCSVETIERWAKGSRKPSGPARVLLARIGDDYGLCIDL